MANPFTNDATYVDTGRPDIAAQSRMIDAIKREQDYARLKQKYPKIANKSYEELLAFEEIENKQKSYQFVQNNDTSQQQKRKQEAFQQAEQKEQTRKQVENYDNTVGNFFNWTPLGGLMDAGASQTLQDAGFSNEARDRGIQAVIRIPLDLAGGVYAAVKPLNFATSTAGAYTGNQIAENVADNYNVSDDTRMLLNLVGTFGGGAIGAGVSNFSSNFDNIFNNGWFRIGNTQYRPSMSTLTSGFPNIQRSPIYNHRLKEIENAYDIAVKNGNLTEAQKLRDEHFKLSAPNSKTFDKQYHGRPENANFTIFDMDHTGEYTTEPIKHVGTKTAAQERIGQGNNILELYTNIQNPISIQDNGIFDNVTILSQLHKNNKINKDQLYQLRDKFFKNSSGLRKFLKDELGIDGFTYINMGEDVGSKSYAFISPNQVKLADAITYDDNGHVIPLSQRDNFNNPDIRYSISTGEPSNNYLLNGQWNLSKIKEDLLAGKQDFIDWIESPAYKASAEANIKEAESMGLKYVPTYEYSSYQNLKNKGVQTVFVNDPNNNSQGWVNTRTDSPVTINLAKAKDIRTINAHEDAHIAKHGWIDPNYPFLDIKKQQEYLRYKNSQVFNDNLADLSEEAGNMFYDFSSSGFPHEAVTNTRDLGKYYGIKVGQPYPGPEKTLQLLNKMEKEARPGFQKKFIQSFRRDPEHLQYVWKALNGTQWIIGGALIGEAAIQSEKKGGILNPIERFKKYRKGGLIPTFKKGTSRKAEYIKSLDDWIAKNPTYKGINTKDFRNYFIELVNLESSYNQNAVQGSYKGWYQLKNLGKDQHASAFNHLSKLLKNNITDIDIKKAKELGISQAALLTKYWNQGNHATNYIHNGIDHADGLGTLLSQYGNDMITNLDFSNYVQPAITTPYTIVDKPTSMAESVSRARNNGIDYSDRENSIIDMNMSRNIKFNPDRLQIGDTVWVTQPNSYPINYPELKEKELNSRKKK